MNGYLYRVYDSTGDLIYIGSTGNLFLRLEQHTAEAWWAGQAAKVRACVFPTVKRARIAEYRAIHDEHPRWNIGRQGPRSGWTARQYEDYITSRRMREAFNLFGGARPTGSSSHFHRVAQEYRVKFGAELLIPEVFEQAS